MPAVRRRSRLVPCALLVGLAWLLAGCSGDGNLSQPAGGDDQGGGGSDLPPCPATAFLTESPVTPADIQSIVGLGNVNPPGHICPTDHVYFYLRMDPGDYSAPVETDLWCPGDLVVTRIEAVEHAEGGLTDFTINLQPCDDITVLFGHVTSLDSTLFGDTSDHTGWRLDSEYTAGGQVYRTWSLDLHLPVTAGEHLGTVGGNAGQFALDMGLYDLSRPPATMASARWDGEWYLYARCPLRYYEPGAVLDSLEARVHVTADADVPDHWCGILHDDIAGTLQGCWFVAGSTLTYPGSNDISFTHWNQDPAHCLIGVGTAVPTVPPEAYMFLPQATGLLNREFADVTPNGRIYGFQTATGGGPLILVRLVSADTLWIEGIDRDTPPEQWAFDDDRSVFVR